MTVTPLPAVTVPSMFTTEPAAFKVTLPPAPIAPPLAAMSLVLLSIWTQPPALMAALTSVTVSLRLPVVLQLPYQVHFFCRVSVLVTSWAPSSVTWPCAVT